MAANEQPDDRTQSFIPLTNESAVSLGYLDTVSALAGAADRAHESLEQIDFLARGRYVSPLYRALIYMGLGNKNEAIRHLELARQEKESFLPVIYSFPLIDPIRDDLRFVDLLGRMGLHVYRTDGKWGVRNSPNAGIF